MTQKSSIKDGQKTAAVKKNKNKDISPSTSEHINSVVEQTGELRVEIEDNISNLDAASGLQRSKLDDLDSIGVRRSKRIALLDINARQSVTALPSAKVVNKKTGTSKKTRIEKLTGSSDLIETAPKPKRKAKNPFIL